MFNFGKITTVDGALTAFNKVLADLRTVKATQDSEVVRQEQIISDAATARAAAEAEAVRAARAIAKIEDFIV